MNNLYEILQAKCRKDRHKRERHPIYYLYNINELEETFEGRFFKAYWKNKDKPLI